MIFPSNEKSRKQRKNKQRGKNQKNVNPKKVKLKCAAERNCLKKRTSY